MKKSAVSVCSLLFVFFSLNRTAVYAQVTFSDWIVTSGQKGWDIVNAMVCDSSGCLNPL